MALTLRRTWSDRPYPKEDWLVMDDGVEVGRIQQDDTAAGEPRWEWALSGAAWRAYQHGIRGSGVAPSLDAAKAAWREAYELGRPISRPNTVRKKTAGMGSQRG